MLDPNEQVEMAWDFISYLEKHNLTYPYLQKYAALFSPPNTVDWIIKNSGGKIPIAAQVSAASPNIR